MDLNASLPDVTCREESIKIEVACSSLHGLLYQMVGLVLYKVKLKTSVALESFPIPNHTTFDGTVKQSTKLLLRSICMFQCLSRAYYTH